MRLHTRAGQVLLGAALVGAAYTACYSAGSGSGPPPDGFYFPVGLAVFPHDVEAAPTVLYVANSDFDLQFSGGTLQSYRLDDLRRDAGQLIMANLGVTDGTPMLPKAGAPTQNAFVAGCLQQFPNGMPLGQLCAPPVDQAHYLIDHVIIGAFATDLQFSKVEGLQRLLAPVRGVAAVTWADVHDDGSFDCGQQGSPDNRCDGNHNTGNDPNQPGDTRNITMPGEPFGMAQTSDGRAIVVTHQTDTKTSLLRALGNADRDSCPNPMGCPAMAFVLDGLPLGGDGIAEIPHDVAATVPPCATPMPGTVLMPSLPCVRPAFLQTNHSTSQIDLVRYYDDEGFLVPDGGAATGSSIPRPFLTHEAAFAINSNAVGIDSRGIAIDPTPRMACRKAATDPSLSAEEQQGRYQTCAQLAARVFFASRTPPALGIGEVGGPELTDTGVYNPDRFVLTGNEPLPPGPSKVYLAPIVNRQGNFELRVFVVLFDSNEIAVYDPGERRVESYIDVGPGPFAMAFDPFVLQDVAEGKAVGMRDDQGNIVRDENMNLPYRFAYVASFTQSFVQMIDLDQSQPTAQTYERVVFTLGLPTLPKGQ